MFKNNSAIIKEILDIEKVPQGAYTLRVNGVLEKVQQIEGITIDVNKVEGCLNVIVANNTKNKSLHMPVVLNKENIKDIVINNFYIGENCDITIVAGCGIDCVGKGDTIHSGIHAFYVGKNSVVKYIEKHIGKGSGVQKEINTKTIINLEDGASMFFDSLQIGGIDRAYRKTDAIILCNGSLNIKEGIRTKNNENVISSFDVKLKGQNSSASVCSRAVAGGNSQQKFEACMIGDNKCFGNVQCDAIIEDNARISSIPKIEANCVDASLEHEAVIGKVAPEQVIKLMTLGLSQEEATNKIIEGFLK